MGDYFKHDSSQDKTSKFIKVKLILHLHLTKVNETQFDSVLSLGSRLAHLGPIVGYRSDWVIRVYCLFEQPTTRELSKID